MKLSNRFNGQSQNFLLEDKLFQTRELSLKNYFLAFDMCSTLTEFDTHTHKYTHTNTHTNTHTHIQIHIHTYKMSQGFFGHFNFIVSISFVETNL